jgi:nitrogen fixation/metabolism regulation signal transduction histidine kinase
VTPAPVREIDATAFEDLGRATLQIVHDLKNQLNGLKLYATFLRKRLERDDQATEERETLLKLIAGLDRAAKEMTALVRYARPMDLRPRSHTDLRSIIISVIDEAAARGTGGLGPVRIASDIAAEPLLGEFDPTALTEAFKAVTDDVRASVSAKEVDQLSLNARRNAHEQTDGATIEWRGGKLTARTRTFPTNSGCGTVHTALAAKIIEAHGGSLTCEGDLIRAWLPISNSPNRET